MSQREFDARCDKYVWVTAALMTLTPLEQEVLRYLYGGNGLTQTRSRTVSEIVGIFQRPRSTIYRVRARGLAKLAKRHNLHVTDMEWFAEERVFRACLIARLFPDGLVEPDPANRA